MEIVANAGIQKILATLFGGSYLDLNTRPFYKYVCITFLPIAYLSTGSSVLYHVCSVWKVIRMVTFYFLRKKRCARMLQYMPQFWKNLQKIVDYLKSHDFSLSQKISWKKSRFFSFSKSSDFFQKIPNFFQIVSILATF